MPYRIKRAKLTGVQRKYFAKLYRIGKLKQRPYSQAYKYRDEIRKMHRLHDQYIFLADNEIHSEADLLKVYEALKEEKEQLSKERSRFYKEKSRYTRLWKLADRMHELEPAERTFKGGDTFFKAEHEEYERLLAEIKKEGYSLSELEEVRSYYDGKEVAHQDMQKECNKKIRIAESLIKEIKDDKDRNGSVPRPEIKRQPTKRTV
jgi:predicted nuclease with TOPRIM domain